MTVPLPLSQFSVKTIRAVFSDLDDTITLESKVPKETYAALWDLKEAGLKTVIVSGRPAGWADCLMRLWPIEAMVFENGAGVMTRNGKKIETRTLADISHTQSRLEAVFSDLKERFPKIKLATDQSYRRFDRAIDFCEEPPHLSQSEVEEILKHLENYSDITAKLSSIHINYWVGKHTKVTACEALVKDFGLDRDAILYCGDSPNDEPMFAHFQNTVGVANIEPYLSRLKSTPKFITSLSGGEGFSEIASLLCRKNR